MPLIYDQFGFIIQDSWFRADLDGVDCRRFGMQDDFQKFFSIEQKSKPEPKTHLRACCCVGFIPYGSILQILISFFY